MVDAVEGLRAKAMWARHAFLVREILLEARNAGLSARSTVDGALAVSAPGGQRVLIQPAIGVPDAERYEVLEKLLQREASLGHTYFPPAILLYDQTGIRKRWLDHLDWLNSSLTCARSMGLADAKEWLSSLKSKGTS